MEGGWEEYFFEPRENQFLRVWAPVQMGIREIEYYCPLSVTFELPYGWDGVWWENDELYGQCIAFYYLLKVDGLGKVTGTQTEMYGLAKYEAYDQPIGVHVERRGKMYYSPRYGLVKDVYSGEDTYEKWWSDPIRWTAYGQTYYFKLDFTESDTITLQNATLSD
jgi:hypothetical protein